MALSSANRAASFAPQLGSVFVAPSTPDYHVAASIGLDFSGVTVENPEFNGTIHSPGPEIIGEKVKLTIRHLMRGPGGAAPPAAGTWVPGRLIASCGFTEVVNAAAIPAAPEAISAGTTSSATLGAGFAATAQLYKGVPAQLSALGALPGGMTMIKDYTAGKVATFAETAAAALTGTIQIPKYLAYLFSDTTPTGKFMSRVHFDKVNYDLFNMVPEQIVFSFNTAGLDNPELSFFEVRYDAEVADWGDTAAPAVTPGSALPLYRCGKQYVANKALGGTGFSITIDLTAERPPNPNTCNGDPPEITRSLRSASINLNHNLKATVDFRNEALVLKTPRSLFGQFGTGAGSMVQAVVPNGVFNVPTLGANGGFDAQQLEMYINEALRGICIAYPYPA